jgi:uncharacterized protein (DUF58 family)
VVRKATNWKWAPVVIVAGFTFGLLVGRSLYWLWLLLLGLVLVAAWYVRSGPGSR